MMMVLQEELANVKKDGDEEFSNLKLISSAFIPNDLVSLGCILVIIYTVRFLEHIFRIPKVIMILFVSFLIDIIIRFLAIGIYNIEIAKCGPVSGLTALYLFYCVMFPTIKSSIFKANEKIVLLLTIILLIMINGLTVVLPVICGALTFVALSPAMISVPHNKEE